MPLRLVSYNIRFGGRGREALIAKALGPAKPDIVVLQEATYPYVVERVAAALDMPYWAARRRHSLAFISRWPVTHEWLALRGVRHPFLKIIAAAPTDAGAAEAGPRLTIFGVHLQPYFSAQSERRRVWEVRSLLSAVDDGSAHALVGDFNAVAPGDDVQTWRMPLWIRLLIRAGGGRIPRDAIALLQESGYIDGYRRLHPAGDGFTFPALAPHVRLDYVFLPTDRISSLKACRVCDAEHELVSRASDHYPLLAVLDV